MKAALLGFAAATLKKALRKMRVVAENYQGNMSEWEAAAEVARDYLRLS